MKSFSYTIQDELGLHARPAGQLVKQAQKYKCTIRLIAGSKSADARRIIGIMQLGVKYGQEVQFSLDGEDEEVAAAELEQFCIQHI